ncbi:UNVERIFIED_ORG: hypothetical protein B5F06_14860 [Lacrimispora saccharolytica]
MPLINSNESGIDSGSEWLGNVPFSWSMVLLSQVVSQVKNKNSDLSEKNLLSLSYGKIKRKPIDTTEGLLPASFDGYNIIEADDIVLRLTDLQNDHTSLRVGISTEKGIITSAYITMRPKNSKTAKFLYYLLHTFDIRKGFYGMGSGVRQGLNYGEVKRLKIPFPAEDEQMAIANFLDNEIMRVDSIISEAKASIEEYKSWKASIIYEVVTKGLDPDVEMKDSGVEWIGEMPVHWRLIPFRYVLQERNERNTSVISKERLSLSIDLGVTLYADKTTNLDRFKEDFSQYKLAYAGDLVMNSMNMIVGASGVSSWFGCVSPAYYTFYDTIEDHVTAKFCEYIFRNKAMLRVLHSLGKGIYSIERGDDRVNTCRLKVSKDDLKKILIPIPPIEEQRKIVRYLKTKCTMLDALVDEKQALIADLESYKKSLIFEVVTGKRRVV